MRENSRILLNIITRRSDITTVDRKYNYNNLNIITDIISTNNIILHGLFKYDIIYVRVCVYFIHCSRIVEKKHNNYNVIKKKNC